MGAVAKEADLIQLPEPQLAGNGFAGSGPVTVPHGEFVTIPNPPCGANQANVSLCIAMEAYLPAGAQIVYPIKYSYIPIIEAVGPFGLWVEANYWADTQPNVDLGWAMILPAGDPVPQSDGRLKITSTFKNWSEFVTRHGSMTVYYQ